MTTRAELHELLDSLPDDALPVAEARLRSITDENDLLALKRWLDSAPLDDEPLTERERAALERAERGETKPIRLTESEMLSLLSGDSPPPA